MVFSSLRFFVFLAAILGVTAIPMPHRRKKLVLCTASCLFYAAWDYRYLALLLVISVIDYFCAARIASSEFARVATSLAERQHQLQSRDPRRTSSTRISSSRT